MRTTTAARAPRLSPRVLATLTLLLAAACTDTAPSRTQPEGATGTSAKALVVAERSMVVAAHPVAAEAGTQGSLRLARSWKIRTTRNAAPPMALEATIEHRLHRTWVPAAACPREVGGGNDGEN